MACSFQPWASSRSIARQMSTLDIEARIRFSATERIASAASSASHTSTSIDRQFRRDRGLHPAVADDDHQPVVLRGHARRLDDADRLDRGEQLFVHRRRHRRAAGIVRIGLEGTGIDAAKFGHDWLLWVGVSSSLCFGKTPPARRIPDRRGKGVRSTGARSATHPCGGGRRCGSRFLPPLSFHFLLVHSALATCFPAVAIRHERRAGKGAIGRLMPLGCDCPWLRRTVRVDRALGAGEVRLDLRELGELVVQFALQGERLAQARLDSRPAGPSRRRRGGAALRSRRPSGRGRAPAGR